MNHLEVNEKILFFFEEKLVAFKQYLSITKQMGETTDDPLSKQLTRLISDRRTCIRKIQNLDKSIEKVLKCGPEKINLASLKSKGLLTRYIQSFKDIIKEILPIDEQVYVLVKNKDDAIKHTLLTFQKSKRAMNGYRAKPKYMPRYLDTKK